VNPVRDSGPSGYSRVTIAGSRRRVDVVIPSDEPVGRLLPEVLRLVGEPPGQPAMLRHLATLDGTLLNADATLADLDLDDGALLRIVGLADAPPPPVVHDVTEEVTADLDRRSWRWGPAPRRWLLTAIIVASSLAAGHFAAQGSTGTGRDVVPLALSGLLLLAGAAVGAGGRSPRPAARHLGTAAILAGGALGSYAAATFGPAVDAGPGWVAGGVAAALAVAAIVLGLAGGAGRAAVFGGLVGLTLLAGWAVALVAVRLPPVRAAAVLGPASLMLIGVLPRIALTFSGLTALDDRRFRGETVERRAVAQALTAAHRGLSVTAVAAAGSAAAAGWVAGAEPGRWTAPLAGLIAAGLAFRARSFPLVGQVLAMAAGSAVVLFGLLLAWLRASPSAQWLALAVVAAVAVAAASALTGTPPEHVGARLRGVADRLEAVTVVAMLPVAFGVFGLFGRLLQTF
jgi:type VII secretion integral membrane protein EccD